jgi:hypothetical protein
MKTCKVGWQRISYLEAGNIFDLAECLNLALSALRLYITRGSAN